MTPARLAFYSTLLLFLATLLWVVFSLILVQFAGPLSEGASIAALSAVGLLAIVLGCFFIGRLLKSNAARYRIQLVDQSGHARILSTGITLSFIFEAFWRSIFVGVVTKAGAAFLMSAYGTDITSDQRIGIDVVAFLVTWFISFWWVYAAPFGNNRIVFDASKILIESQLSTIPVRAAPHGSLRDSVSSLKEAITGILGVIFAVSYFGLGLLQLAAVVDFFHSVLGWWFIISVLVAGFVAYIPIVGALAGSYAAVNAWGWAWYAAGALFFFPVIVWLAITLLAGAAVATQALFGGRTRNVGA
jgi:hypothetical protein